MVKALVNNIGIQTTASAQSKQYSGVSPETDFAKLYEKQTLIEETSNSTGNANKNTEVQTDFCKTDKKIAENSETLLRKNSNTETTLKPENGAENGETAESQDNAKNIENVEISAEKTDFSFKLTGFNSADINFSEDVTDIFETTPEEAADNKDYTQAFELDRPIITRYDNEIFETAIYKTANEETMQQTEQPRQILNCIAQNIMPEMPQIQEVIDTEQEFNIEMVTITNEDLKTIQDANEFGTALKDYSLKLPVSENLTSKNIQKTSETENTTLEDIIDEEMLDELKIESIEADSAGTGSERGEGSLMQNQSPEEQGIKAILQSDVEFMEIKPEIKADTASASSKTSSSNISPEKIIEQISKQIEGMKTGSKLNMVLNPESLGKVSVEIINTGEGLSAQFTVASQEAKDLIMKGLDGLKDALYSHGLGVDSLTVKTAETQKSEYDADWTEQEGSRGGNKEQNAKNKEQKDGKHFEDVMAFAENEESNNV